MWVAKSCAACIASSAVPSGSSRCIACASTASHGAICRSLGRSGIRSDTASAAAVSPGQAQLVSLPDGGVGVGLALRAGRLGRVRRAGHHVNGVLLPAPGASRCTAGPRDDSLAGHQVPGVDRCGPARRARSRRSRVPPRTRGRRRGRRTAGTTARARSCRDTTARRPSPLSCQSSSRIVSRFASVCPSASIRVFSRARTRSPVLAGFPSASTMSVRSATWRRSISRSRTSRESLRRLLVRRGQQQRVPAAYGDRSPTA